MATDIRLKEGLNEITESLVATYTECSRINHLGHQPLPNREMVVEIIDELFEVIYPGFARRQNLHFGNIEYYVGNLVDSLHEKLTQQIARALRHELCDESPHADFEALAQKRAIEFLRACRRSGKRSTSTSPRRSEAIPLPKAPTKSFFAIRVWKPSRSIAQRTSWCN